MNLVTWGHQRVNKCIWTSFKSVRMKEKFVLLHYPIGVILHYSSCKTLVLKKDNTRKSLGPARLKIEKFVFSIRILNTGRVYRFPNKGRM